mmetsp:Transcript_2996/g.6258  ORF Transcript_2996/g.6258 Transcript_2996/m.6258 type:complete len:80 (-) Transcript_2996:49-288(-)
MVRVLVAVANGSEEIETLTPVDLLRRAGAEVVLAASGPDRQVRLSRGDKWSESSSLSLMGQKRLKLSLLLTYSEEQALK